MRVMVNREAKEIAAQLAVETAEDKQTPRLPLVIVQEQMEENKKKKGLERMRSMSLCNFRAATDLPLHLYR